ncbi:MAG: hypothetical protein KDJ37_01925 [Hyphomicrobiaceae bacterium]|nr:hypothetical protein [Hyphomicrobiaceae bacterium]
MRATLLLSTAMMFSAGVGLALAQEPPARITGSEPPGAAAAAPSASSVRLSQQELDKRIKKLTKEFSDMQSRIGEGNSISTKWAATAELFSKYAVEANNTAAECELTKSRKARAEQAGLSARMLNQLSSRVKDCSAEVLRMVALTGHHSRVLASVEEAVERVSLEVKFLGEEADTNARDRLKYELEKKLNGEVDEAKRTLVKFDPRNKSIPTN